MNIENINICIISLPERTQRFTRSLIELNKFFEKPNIHLIEGVIDERPMIGIATAHMNAIQLAKDNNWEYVFICEDDLRFQSQHSKTYAVECFQNVPEDFDLLLSGVYSTEGLKKHNTHWNRTDEFSALHFYLVHNKAYDKILSFDKSLHIDHWMAKNDNLKCYVTEQFFCIQYDGYSDNAQQDVQYEHLLKKFRLLK